MLSRVISLFAVALLLIIPVNEGISYEEKVLMKVRIMNEDGIRELEHKIDEKRVLELIDKMDSSNISSDEKYQILIEFLEKEIRFPAKKFIEAKRNLLGDIFILAGWGIFYKLIDAIWMFFADYLFWFIGDYLSSFLNWDIIIFLYDFLFFLFPTVHHLILPVTLFAPFFFSLVENAYLWIIEKDGYNPTKIDSARFISGYFFTGCWIEIDIVPLFKVYHIAIGSCYDLDITELPWIQLSHVLSFSTSSYSSIS